MPMSTLHEHPNPPSLVPLLRSRLPASLPALSALLTPGEPVTVYTTFDPTTCTEEDLKHELWCVWVDMGSQTRFFLNAVASGRDDKSEGYALLQRVVEYALQRSARQGKQAVRIGAIPDKWMKAIESVTGVRCISASRIWSDPSYFSTVRDRDPLDLGELVVPQGFELREAREEHISEILSTSEVPHLPSYLLTRLSHTSCVFSTASECSPTARPSSPQSVLVAHVTTHRDGSLGTLYVSPLYRRRGLARLVLLHRIAAMRQGSDERLGYSYVHRENEGSRAVMSSLGWSESEENVWWNIVGVTDWESRCKAR